MKRVFGFTLAEVLITLAIVGVIAALTIPTLMKNYQNHIQVVALKRSMHNLQTYVDRLMTDKDCLGNDLSCTGYFGNVTRFSDYSDTTGRCGYSDYFNHPFSEHLYKGYEKKYGFIQTIGTDAKDVYGRHTNYWYMGNEAQSLYLMPDGAIYSSISDCRWNRIRIWVDTNGLKGPNQPGRDIFHLDIKGNGKVGLHECPASLGPLGESYGYCAAYWIATHGWKIDY